MAGLAPIPGTAVMASASHRHFTMAWWAGDRVLSLSHSSSGRGARDQITSKSMGRRGRICRKKSCHARYIR